MSRFITDTLDGIEITRAKDVAKHGDHDQSSHGSWAQGGNEDSLSQETAAKIQQFTREWGGLSIKMTDGSMPDKGYMVSKPTSLSRIVPSKDFYDPKEGWKILREYEREHSADLATGRNYLGTWENEGKVFLDVSQNIMDRNEATSLGASRDQKKIWDVVNQLEIDTGGTGGVKKGSSYGGMERHFGNVRGREGRLRKGTLGEIDGQESRRPAKVIYFDYGLKPVFKHEGAPGHDQLEHGSWATGRSAEDVKRISRMKNLGPSLEELDNAKDGGNSEIDRDKAKMMIDNDSNVNDEIESRISDLISNLEEQDGKEMSEDEKLTNYDSFRSQVIEEYISENADNLEQYARENGYGSLKDPQVSAALVESFQEVYGVEITSDRKGDPITLRSRVEEVYVDGEGIHVISNVFDDNDNTVNTSEVHRIFSKDEDSGTWSVEHKLLELEPDYRGLGFGGKFLQQSEDWYISKGVTHIVLNAGLEDGARHWANAGFDWNRDELPFIVDAIQQRVSFGIRSVENNSTGLMGVSEKKYGDGLLEAKALLGRMRDGVTGDIKDMKNDDFPKPADFARLGAKSSIIAEDGSPTWTGKELLRGLYVPYIKVLTAEGSNLLAGPIDMDGDGLIYDGTPREKPAPSSGNK